jgi:hypothetical protein
MSRRSKSSPEVLETTGSSGGEPETAAGGRGLRVRRRRARRHGQTAGAHAGPGKRLRDAAAAAQRATHLRKTCRADTAGTPHACWSGAAFLAGGPA